jgi:apolipoprotein N-acyltransferase
MASKRMKRTGESRRAVAPQAVALGASPAPTRTRRIRWLGLLSAPLLVLTFPAPSLAPLVFVALVPLLLATRGLPFKKRVLLGAAVGFVAQFGLFYTVAELLQTMSDVPALAAWPLFALVCVYHSLLWATFAAFAEPLRALAPRAAGLTVPSLLVLLEFAFPQLFPWYVGSAVAPLGPVGAALDLVGVHGMSFLVCAGNVAIAEIVDARFSRGESERRFERGWALGLAAGVLLVLGYGFVRDASVREAIASTAARVRYAIVQPNYTAAERRSVEASVMAAMGERLLSQLRSLPAGELDVVVIGEGSFPFPYVSSPPKNTGEAALPTRVLAREVAAEARRLRAHLLFGTPRFETPESPPRNSLVHVDATGAVVRAYDKIRLVPFGERMPFEVLRKLFPRFEDLAPGESRAPIDVGHALLAPSICYELMFPWEGRAAVVAAAEKHGAAVALVNATNDVWFGIEGNAAALHFALQRARTIENRVPLLRAANTGISAVVGADGRILAQSPVGTAEVLRGVVAVPALSSVYRSFGELWALLPFAASAVVLLRAAWRRRRTRA